MKQITLFLILYLSLGHFSLAFGQANWNSHYEDKNVKIEYQLADCTDRANDTDFTYYILRFINKTKKQLNVQFETSDSKDLIEKQVGEENRTSFILEPLETREGNCSSFQKELKQFVRINKNAKEKTKDKLLLILNVKTYEL